ncbi:MAG TPA: glycoside hydrolase family 32 protein [Devosia sp.]|nr:glycoside hydrolase family 32 protein [Devosia sp.]
MTPPRPIAHVTAPSNWLSDPNGPIYWKGQYHVFYQHNPASVRWGLMHWGHVVSDDLINWTDQGIALRPTADGPDRDGCWSGCIREIEGRAVAFYTGASGTGDHHRQVVIRAVGNERLSAFQPDPPEPVIGAVEPWMETLQQRDPFVFRWGDHWTMLLGTGMAPPNAPAGAVVAWVSHDTREWTYRGIVFTRARGASQIDTGPVWECPQLVPFDGQWLLMVSVQLPGVPDPLCRRVMWYLGIFDGSRFVAEAEGVVDGGEVFYAPAIAEAPDGRKLLWAWLQESQATRGRSTGQWAGAFGLVREITIENGALRTVPAREIAAGWRVPFWSAGAAGIQADRVVTSPPHPGETLRLQLSVLGGGYRVILGSAGDGREVALVIESIAEGATLTAMIGQESSGAIPLDASSSELDVFVDVSIVEVFANGGSLTFRVDPAILARDGVRLTAPAERRISTFTITDRA